MYTFDSIKIKPKTTNLKSFNIISVHQDADVLERVQPAPLYSQYPAWTGRSSPFHGQGPTESEYEDEQHRWECLPDQYPITGTGFL